MLFMKKKSKINNHNNPLKEIGDINNGNRDNNNINNKKNKIADSLKMAINFLKSVQADYLLVNSTNEYLSEYSDLKENARYILTNFSGSTGDALVTKNGEVFLFVDARYHVRATNEAYKYVNVVKLKLGQKQDEEIAKIITNNSAIVIVAKKNSVFRVKNFKHLFKKKNIKLKIIDEDPINNYTDPIDYNFSKVKNCKPKKFVPKNATFISDLEEVSYLTGLRNFARPCSSKIFAKLFIDAEGNQYLFTNEKEMKEILKSFFKKNSTKQEEINAIIENKMINGRHNGIQKQSKMQKQQQINMQNNDKKKDTKVSLKEDSEEKQQIIKITIDPKTTSMYYFNFIKNLSKQSSRSSFVSNSNDTKKNNKNTVINNNNNKNNDINNKNSAINNNNAIENNICYKIKILEKKSEIAKIKSIKTNEEIDAMERAFEISDKSLLEVRKYINENDNLSEFDIATKLINCFYKFGAKSLSFEPIVAIDKNSALPHYGGNSKDVFLKSGSIVLIDCGIYGNEGLATDTTRVFVKDEPNILQKQIYTLVLKAFLKAYSDDSKNGYELDAMIRDFFDKNKVDNFVFSHGLGHGIGISVHEMPPSLSKSKVAKTKLQNGMTFTIEPGLYNVEKFGIRLENSFYKKNNRKISFVKIGFERKLIDFSFLKKKELFLLKDFALI